MRFYSISLFILCLYIAGGLMTVSAPTLGFTESFIVSPPNATEVQQWEEYKTKIQTNSTTSASNPVTDALGIFYQGVINVANQMFSAAFPLIQFVTWLPAYMVWIGVPSAWAWAIFTIITILEVVGFYEMYSGRDVEK